MLLGRKGMGLYQVHSLTLMATCIILPPWSGRGRITMSGRIHTNIADMFLHNSSNYIKYTPHFSSHFNPCKHACTSYLILIMICADSLHLGFIVTYLDSVIWDFQYDRKHKICLFNGATCFFYDIRSLLGWVYLGVPKKEMPLKIFKIDIINQDS